MRKLVLLALSLALIAGTLLWGINVVFALEQVFHLSILGLKPAAVPYMARVDLSTVTPLVLVLTLFAMIRGAWGLDRWVAAGKDPGALWRPHYPFPPGLRGLLIQLGLLGTIFAFIVAFNDLATSTSASEAAYNPAVLIAPLGTALWSTFAGIAVAFLVLPPVEYGFARAMGVEDPTEATVRELDAVGVAMEELERQGKGSAAALAQLTSTVEALHQGLNGLGDVKALVELAKGLKAALEPLPEALAGTRDALAALPEPVQEMTHQMRAVGAELELERQAIHDLARSVAGSAPHLAVLADPQAGVGAIRAGLGGLGRELTALRADLARIEVDLKVLVRGLLHEPAPPSHLGAPAARVRFRRAAP